MKKTSWMALVFVCFCIHPAFADKIHLKSGKILEGKIRDKKHPMENWFKEHGQTLTTWCKKGQVELWHGHDVQCLKRSEITKIEKEFKKPKGVALLAKENLWGPGADGLRIQLIAASDEYVVGKPMLFHVLLQNNSDETQWYNDQERGSLYFKVMGPDGKEVPRKKRFWQIFEYIGFEIEEPLDIGEIEILQENYNLSGEFAIVEPGSYEAPRVYTRGVF